MCTFPDLNVPKFFVFSSKSKISKISVVKNILSLMPNIDSNEEFVVELVKACNGMINSNDRNNFTNTVSIFSTQKLALN